MLDNAIIKFKCMLNSTSLDPMTDPLEELSKTGETDAYTKGFLSSIYQVILVVFLSGIAITGVVALIKILLAPNGKGRSDAKSELILKFALLVGFFAAVPLFGLLVAAIFSLI